MNASKAIKHFLDGYFATNVRRKKTKSAYLSDLEQFKKFFGAGFDISKLAYTDIERWAAHLADREYLPASIRRKIVVLKVFCSYWVRHGIINESPFWRVKINFGKIMELPRTMDEDEIQTLLFFARANYSAVGSPATCSTSVLPVKLNSSSREYRTLRNLALIELLFATGLRVGEVSAIDLRDFSYADLSLKVHGKGGKERMAFFVDEETMKIQRKYLSARMMVDTESPALFLNASGKRLSTQGIANSISQMRIESGIKRHITPHMFRHTIATFLLRNGVDIRIVQEFLGHASIATTQRYTHITKEHLIRELQNRHPSITFRRSEKAETLFVRSEIPLRNRSSI